MSSSSEEEEDFRSVTLASINASFDRLDHFEHRGAATLFGLMPEKTHGSLEFGHLEVGYAIVAAEEADPEYGREGESYYGFGRRLSPATAEDEVYGPPSEQQTLLPQSVFVIQTILAHPGTGGHGLGRRFLNICLAAMASGTSVCRTLVLSVCHWPAFRLTDRFHHMHVECDAPWGTQPLDLLCPWWPIYDTDPDRARKEQENAAVRYDGVTNIFWSTPLEWFRWRTLRAGNESLVAYEQSSAVVLVMHIESGHRRYPWHPFGSSLVINSAPLHYREFDFDPEVVRWIGRHCRLLRHGMRTGVVATDDMDHVSAIVVNADPCQRTSQPRAVDWFQRWHTLLVDYARTVYRPILYTSTAFARIHRMLGQRIDDPTLWPVPKPAIARLQARNGEWYHIWVPQRKPASVYHDTGVLLPLDVRQRPEQPLAQAAFHYDGIRRGGEGRGVAEEERPTKRVRLDACFNCQRAGAAFADGLVVHCDAVCRDAYYHCSS